jgi:hypothetical protein
MNVDCFANNYVDEEFIFYNSSSDFANKEIFQDHVINYIIPKIVNKIQKINKITKKNNKALLILDGASSRKNIDLWRYSNKLDIMALILPAYSSHLLQPLDLTINGLIKKKLHSLPSFFLFFIYI